MKINSATVSGEAYRQQSQQSTRGINRGLQQKLGTISDVHPNMPMIKVIFSDGVIAAGGDWIPVGHSVLDIIHRFGELRIGLRVMITFSGEVETAAIASIVGVEDEKIGNEIKEANELDSTIPWELFRGGN